MLLTETIQELYTPSEPDATSIFEDSLPTVFSDPRVQHGEPGEYLLYKNEELGDFKLKLATPDPSNTSLFSHFIWNVLSSTPPSKLAEMRELMRKWRSTIGSLASI